MNVLSHAEKPTSNAVEDPRIEMFKSHVSCMVASSLRTGVAKLETCKPGMSPPLAHVLDWA